MARGARQRRLVAAVAGLLLAAPPPAGADEHVSGRSTERGVEITVERFTPGQRAGGTGNATGDATGSGAAGGGASCSLFPWIFEPGTAKGGIPPTPQHRRFVVICDGGPVGTTWVGPADPLAAAASRAVEIAAVAERVLRQIPVGDIRIGRRPEGRTLTGLPVYLWVDGYDGRPIVDTVQELGATVDVRITLRQVAWDFGDGTPPVVAGLGEPWPQRSSVRHVYGTTTPAGRPATIAARLAFTAEYRVDGGSWLALTPVSRSASAPVEVDEVQAVRNR